MQLLTFVLKELFDVLVPKNGVVGDLITGLIKKANLEDEDAKGPIRVYEAQHSKFYKEFTRDFSVVGFTDYSNLYAERIPEEEIGPELSYIYAFHFQAEPTKPHGVPFRFTIHEVGLCTLILGKTY